MVNSTYTLTEACQMTGVTVEVLRKWIGFEIIPAKSQARRDKKGSEYCLGKTGIAAVALVATLKRRGAPLELVRIVGNYLGRLPTESLERASVLDLIFLASAGGSIEPQFFSASEILCNRTGFAELLLNIPARELLKKVNAGILWLEQQKEAEVASNGN